MPVEKFQPASTREDVRAAQIKRIFPEAVKDGEIDLDALRQCLARQVPARDGRVESFNLDFPGKADAKRASTTLPRGTLIPATGEGHDEARTRNVFIEGENLEVLKLLHKAYAGKVKMIYIDPPYNTGKDFIYNDDFNEPIDVYLKRTGVIDADGHMLSTNTKVEGRFHSRWLSMMYPRLRLARDLLREDGVMFVSIGDDELANLKLIMNEIFGPECFIANFIWNTEGHTDNQLEVKVNHEYILCYRKDADVSALNSVVDPNTPGESNLRKGYAENSVTKNGTGNPPSIIRLRKGFPSSAGHLHVARSAVDPHFFTDVERLGYISRDITKKYGCEYPIRLNDMIIKDHALAMDCDVFSGWANANKLRQFNENGFVPLKESDGELSFFISNNGVVYYHKERQAATNILSVLRNFGTTERARSSLEKEGIYFSYPKPVELITYLLQLGLKENDLVVDFFAGCGTTGIALYEYNKANDTAARFLLVQMAEPVPPSSVASQKGFGSIDGIARATLRVYSERHRAAGTPNTGFKVFHLRRSHFKPWKDIVTGDVSTLDVVLDHAIHPFVDGWRVEDLLVEIMLAEGFPLDSLIKIDGGFKGNTVHEITSNGCDHALLVCLDTCIADETIQVLGTRGNSIFICLDAALTDQGKIRLAEKGLVKTI